MDPPHLGVLLSDLTLLFPLLFPCSAPILPLLIAFCCPPPSHPWLFNRFSIIILPLLLIYFCGFAVANWATNKPHDRDHRQSIDTIWGGLIKLSSKKSALILSKRQQNWQQPWQILKRTTLCGCNCHDCSNYEAKSREENKRSRKVEVEVEKNRFRFSLSKKIDWVAVAGGEEETGALSKFCLYFVFVLLLHFFASFLIYSLPRLPNFRFVLFEYFFFCFFGVSLGN